MQGSSSKNALESYVLSHPVLKEKYQDFLKRHTSFRTHHFHSWLLFFDFVLKDKNKALKQIPVRSAFLKRLSYLISLVYNRIRHDRKGASIPWWSQITENIFLGALPLQKHLPQFEGLGISCVVTLVEPFEQRDSLVASPLRYKHYLEKGIDNQSFPTPDFRPMSLVTLYDATCYLKTFLDSGCKAYIHCKAGRGRSAAVVMAYLTLFGGYTYEKAEALILQKRPHIDLVNKAVNLKALHSLHSLFFGSEAPCAHSSQLGAFFS